MGLADTIVAGLPQTDPIGRSARMRDLVLGGHALELRFVPILSTLSEQGVPRWIATFQVSTDAIQIGTPGDSFRPTFTDEHQIELANALGLSRPTGLLADLTWAAAPLQLPPHLHGNTEAERKVMGTAPVMLLHSREIDADLARLAPDMPWDPIVLRRPVGKDWCASNGNTIINGVRHATNYGWHTTRPTRHKSLTLPGVNVEQPFASAHWWNHTDYSQTATFVRPDVQLLDIRTGQIANTNLHDVNADPVLAKLWSHEGTIHEALPERSRLSEVKWIAYGAIGAIAIGVLAAAISQGAS